MYDINCHRRCRRVEGQNHRALTRIVYGLEDHLLISEQKKGADGDTLVEDRKGRLF